jgi:hypothetical protein
MITAILVVEKADFLPVTQSYVCGAGLWIAGKAGLYQSFATTVPTIAGHPLAAEARGTYK